MGDAVYQVSRLELPPLPREIGSKIIMALCRIFDERSLEGVCWAFGASSAREIQSDRIQSLCNVLCLWLSECVDDMNALYDKSLIDETGAAVWGAVQGAATEMIYQYVHWEKFTPYRFTGFPELAAGLPCPRTDCNFYLRSAHGGCCDAICRCGIIVEEKKKKTISLAEANGKVNSGALDSATPDALECTWFFIHASDGSYKLPPGKWERRPIQCIRCDKVATHNAPGEKSGLMCSTCCPEDWDEARQKDTKLFFDYRDATPIDGILRLASRMKHLNIDDAARVLLNCQQVCIHLWRERDSRTLHQRQILWQSCRPTNWQKKLKEWWSIESEPRARGYRYEKTGGSSKDSWWR